NRDPLVHEMIVSTIWGSPTLSQLGRLPSIPVVSAAGDGAARVRVRAAGGRRVRVRLTTAVQTGWRRLPLLVADLDGTGDDTFVLLAGHVDSRSEEHTSELQSRFDLVCRLLLEK